MKRILLTAIAFFLVSSVCFAQMRGGRITEANLMTLDSSGNVVPKDERSVAIGTTTLSPTTGVSTVQAKREAVVLSTAKTLAETDLSKHFDVTTPVIVRLLNPSASYAGYFPTTFDTRSGATFFITSGSLGATGTTYWSTDVGAAVAFEWTGVSVFPRALSGTWTKF